MLRKKELHDRITALLSVTAAEIGAKNANNLLDDNIFWEDITKDLLNACLDWDLVNLNQEAKNYPGIDLGDKSRHIGVQVTSTKTSAKIQSSLNEIVKNHVDQEFNEIYFFILGSKQKSYSVKFDDYSSLDCSVDNIWDFSDIISWCVHYDRQKRETVHSIISQELYIPSEKNIIPIEVKQSIRALKYSIHQIITAAEQYLKVNGTSEDLISIASNCSDTLVAMLPYLDEGTYATCEDILSLASKLGSQLRSCNKDMFLKEILCENILCNRAVEMCLREASELISKDISDFSDGINIIIDGNNLFERLHCLGIDCDILYRQFSVAEFLDVIESSICRDIKQCVVTFAKDQPHYNDFIIDRLNSEGTCTKVFDHYSGVSQFICTQTHDMLDLILISSCSDIVNNVSQDNKDLYLHTVSFENDLAAQLCPMFFSKCELNYQSLVRCFNYEENRRVNIKDITEEIFRDLIANANDSMRHQLRVDFSGDVYISTRTSPADLDGVKFRWEAWEAGNGYVGPRIASDPGYITETFASLMKNWNSDTTGYCDYYAL